MRELESILNGELDRGGDDAAPSVQEQALHGAFWGFGAAHWALCNAFCVCVYDRGCPERVIALLDPTALVVFRGAPNSLHSRWLRGAAWRLACAALAFVRV